MIVHTDKGSCLIESIKQLAKIMPVPQEEGTRRNPYLFRSVIPHSNMKRFFKALDKEDFDELVVCYATDEFVLKDFFRCKTIH